MDRAGCGLEDIALFDFYSCFPIAVSNATEAIGLAPDDPRGLTVTGGLPYFGGPGNSYSMHALAEMVMRLRAAPGKRGLIGANGGFLSKYAVGIYSSTPVPYQSHDNVEFDEAMLAAPQVEFVAQAEGQGVVEAHTVAFDREGAGKYAVISGRLEASGARFLAQAGRESGATLDACISTDPGGRQVQVSPGERGNNFVFV